MTNRKSFLTSILALGLVFSGTAIAEAGYKPEPPAPPAQPAPGAQPDRVAIDDQTIQEFANAYEEVVKIQSRLYKDLEGVTDSDEARAMQQDAQEQMLIVVKSNGLTVQDYNAVAQAMQRDTGLRDEIFAYIEN